MSGAAVKFDSGLDDRATRDMLTRLQKAADDLSPAMKNIGEALLQSTEERFRTESGPDGQRWQDVKPATRKRKKNPKILTESGRLRQSINYRAGKDSVSVGTNLKYAAIHQFGGKIKQAARRHKLYFHHDERSGRVGNRFVKKGKSNFAQEVTRGATVFDMPARPFLGINEADQAEAFGILEDHVRMAIEGG